MMEELKKLGSMIYLSECLSRNLSFRDSADKLFEYVNDLERSTIFLDFAGVIFMSRAFAYQYLKNKEAMSKEIIEINKTFDIMKMLGMVKEKMRKIENGKQWKIEGINEDQRDFRTIVEAKTKYEAETKLINQGINGRRVYAIIRGTLKEVKKHNGKQC